MLRKNLEEKVNQLERSLKDIQIEFNQIEQGRILLENKKSGLINLSWKIQGALEVIKEELRVTEEAHIPELKEVK